MYNIKGTYLQEKFLCVQPSVAKRLQWRLLFESLLNKGRERKELQLSCVTSCKILRKVAVLQTLGCETMQPIEF